MQHWTTRTLLYCNPPGFTRGFSLYVYMHTNIPNMTLFPIFGGLFHLTYEGYSEVTYIKLVRVLGTFCRCVNCGFEKCRLYSIFVIHSTMATHIPSDTVEHIFWGHMVHFIIAIPLNSFRTAFPYQTLLRTYILTLCAVRDSGSLLMHCCKKSWRKIIMQKLEKRSNQTGVKKQNSSVQTFILQ